jgi:hypothetical protein
MKAVIRVFFFSINALVLLLPAQFEGQSSTNSTSVSAEELLVYAAVLDSLPKLGSSSRPLIADKTSTFACDETICNGFTIGSCNGLRGDNETPSERMAVVKHDLPELQLNTISSFIEQNGKCASITGRIPTFSNYHLFSDREIPKSWKYSYIVYFSRVAFNPEHTQALLNVGLMSVTNASDSKGRYVVLKNISGKWVLGEGSAMWQLSAAE